MEISDISMRNFETSGNAQIRMGESGLSIKAGEHGGICTLKWRSLAEKVMLHISRNGGVFCPLLRRTGE